MRLGLTLAFVTLAAAPVAAQAPPLPAAHSPFTLERTEHRPLDVPVNNEHYLLSIALPPSYEKERARRTPAASPRPSTGACGSPSARTWTGRAQGNRIGALRSEFRP
jgi:hypothetical protein